MILSSFTYLLINYLYLFLNIFELSYFGIFYITIANLLYCSIKIFWNIYLYWLNNFFEEIILLNWNNLSNNIHIFVEFKENFLNNLLSFIMILGATIVSTFVFFEMNNDKEGHNFIIVLGYFIIFMFFYLF